MSEDLIIPAVCLIAGAAWQWWDGHGQKYGGVRTLVRLAIAAVIASFAVWLADLSMLQSIACVVVALLNTHMGYTKWESYQWMIPRFGGPALIIFALTGSWLYVLLCAGAGALYPKLSEYPRGEELARLPRGAAILGGLALLPYMAVGPWVQI